MEKMQTIDTNTPTPAKQIEQRDGMYVLPIGNAAVVDNASILETKIQKIDEIKKANVATELEQYMPALESLRSQFPEIEAPYKRLGLRTEGLIL